LQVGNSLGRQVGNSLFVAAGVWAGSFAQLINTVDKPVDKLDPITRGQVLPVADTPKQLSARP
jgi:hypothetical protein